MKLSLKRSKAFRAVIFWQVQDFLRPHRYLPEFSPFIELILPRKNGHRNYAAFSSCSSYCIGVCSQAKNAFFAGYTKLQ